MGLLDPKLDKERTLELLRKKGAVRVVLEFSGGHDEGAVESITLYDAYDNGQDLPTWYCGGYGMEKVNGEYQYVPLSEPANEDEELADLLEGPINEAFGAWDGVSSTQGTLTWDVESQTAKLEYDQETYIEHHKEVTF